MGALRALPHGVAADEAVVCAMLFSSVPSGPPMKRLNVEKNAKPSSAAVMLPPPGVPILAISAKFDFNCSL